MKRFIKASPLILVTFIIGVLVALCFARLYVRRVSLCRIAQNPAAYNGKLVRIEAIGSVISSGLGDKNYLQIYQACKGDAVGSSVSLASDVQLSHEADEFINSQTLEIREARVVVDGVFNEWASLGCFTPQYGIKNATVTLKSAVISQPFPAREYH